MKAKTYKVSRERAIRIAADHNCVSVEIAKGYTDSEFKEVLRHLSQGATYKLKPNF